MTWLVTHMYAVLAATGAASLLLGWAVRGAFARARIDKVIGERRIIQADLDGSKEEIERLYSAQRRASLDGATSVADPAVKAEIDSRDKRIADLTAEINRLKSEPKKPVGGPPVIAAPPLAEGAEEPTLVWRNRHLESRIRHLESVVATPNEAPEAAVAVAAPAMSAVPAASGSIDLDKQRWRLEYLTTRAKALEEELLARPSAPALAPADVPAPQPAETAAPGGDQEELARLRWRNRFLEGRLAYFEGEKTEKDVKATAAPAPLPASAAAMAAAVATAAPRDDAPLASALLSRLEQADAELDAAEAVATVSALEKVQPQALKGPVEGKADDLTAIGGIGPKIQDVLFKLGIYHFDQIASWTPENVAWINQHLDFEGRIQREGWVEQAAVLAGEA
jgi:predicted flap endonuclease-1-like 5' DNA nuclease